MGTEQKKTLYPPRTAGRLATPKVPLMRARQTFADMFKLLAEGEFDTINYVYVEDGDGKLTGVVSIREAFSKPRDATLETIITRELITAHPYTDQERVAQLALKHNLKAIPIIDKESRFLGAVPSDTILSILDQEGTENLFRFGGITGTGGTQSNVSSIKSFMSRIPWLIVGLFGGIAAASIVTGFENLLTQNIIIAAFIPLIVYMAAATGAQMQAFIIRDLATNPGLAFFRYLFSEFKIAILISVLSSALLFGLNFFQYGEMPVALVLATALFFAMMSSLITGIAIPYLSYKWKFDPANVSGPVGTVIQDLMSVTLYLSVAAFFLG